MLKVDHKTANLATLQNFDICDRKKMDAGIGVSDPKLIKFDWFQPKYIFVADQCNNMKLFEELTANFSSCFDEKGTEEFILNF